MDINVTDLISFDQVMKEQQLGPNGGRRCLLGEGLLFVSLSRLAILHEVS